MWSLIGKTKPTPPPPPRRRFSKFKLRRYATGAFCGLLLSCATIILLSNSAPSPQADNSTIVRPKDDTSISKKGPAGAVDSSLVSSSDVLSAAPLDSDKPPSVPGGAANADMLSTTDPERSKFGRAPAASGVLDESLDASEISARVRQERKTYFAGYEPGVQSKTFGSRSGMDATDGGSIDASEKLCEYDFIERFGISLTNSCVVPLKARLALKGHDITMDGMYKFLKRTGRLSPLLARYGPTIERQGVAVGAGDDAMEQSGDGNLFYVHMSPTHDKGYGLFADRDLPNRTILGEYGGKYVMCNKVENTDYLWDLPAFSILGDNGDMRMEEWGVDATEMGNSLRFCNDLGPGSWNVATRYVPMNGLWHVIYETIAPVQEGQELSISYGKSYWARRQKLQERTKRLSLYK